MILICSHQQKSNLNDDKIIRLNFHYQSNPFSVTNKVSFGLNYFDGSILLEFRIFVCLEIFWNTHVDILNPTSIFIDTINHNLGHNIILKSTEHYFDYFHKTSMAVITVFNQFSRRFLKLSFSVFPRHFIFTRQVGTCRWLVHWNSKLTCWDF